MPNHPNPQGHRFVRERSLARRTGTYTSVEDLKHPDATSSPPDSHRWHLSCDTHGTFHRVATVSQATRQASTPDEWCPPCKDLVAHDLKVCRECGEPKSRTSDFYQRTDSAGPKNVCKDCYATQATPYQQLPPERKARRLEYAREYRLATKYGLTVEQYEAMLEAQEGVCAICEQPETKTSRASRVHLLAVDHDHATGAVRSLLCNRCNQVLGLMLDDPDLLRAAAHYVVQHKDTNTELLEGLQDAG